VITPIAIAQLKDGAFETIRVISPGDIPPE
jgi:hypothetical protein